MSAWYNKIFAAVYDYAMAGVEAGELSKWRRDLLSGLHGRVLEIGSGTGVNFPFYPEDVQLIASDPSAPMLKRARKKIPKDKDIKLVHAGVASQELEGLIEPESLDAVVSTLVLCTVPHPEEAIEKFWNWLKPGGKIVLLEHIHAQKPASKRIQQCINPLWKAMADGCNLTRSTDVLFRQSAFECIEEHYDVKVVRWYRAVYQKKRKKI